MIELCILLDAPDVRDGLGSAFTMLEEVDARVVKVHVRELPS